VESLPSDPPSPTLKTIVLTSHLDVHHVQTGLQASDGLTQPNLIARAGAIVLQ
jgi:hypothetical protein